MLRIMLPISSMIAACTPSPQDLARPNEGAHPQTGEPQTTASAHPGSAAAIGPEQAAQGPMVEAVSVSENPAPSMTPRVSSDGDSLAEAQGRRMLSTAFVRVGPDGRLSVQLRDGRVLVLRDVVMRPHDYCGVEVPGLPGRARYCGGYGDVAAARPGGALPFDRIGPAPDFAAPTDKPGKRK